MGKPHPSENLAKQTKKIQRELPNMGWYGLEKLYQEIFTLSLLDYTDIGEDASIYHT